MKYLIDTIAFNKYFEFNKNPTCQIPANMNITELADLLSNANANGNEVWVHTATMHELLIRCYRNDKVQKYRDKNLIDIGQFADFYRFIAKEQYKILNEIPDYFCWQKIVSHYNEGTNLYIKEFIEIKKNMECEFLFDYIRYVTSICTYAWYDEYKSPEENEYMHDLNLFIFFSKCMFQKVKDRLNEILDGYYYNHLKKENVNNEVDFLLGYMLNKYEDLIKNKRAKIDDVLYDTSLLIARMNEFQGFINQIRVEKICNRVKGAEYAKTVLSNHKTDLKLYVKEFSEGVFDKLPYMTETAKAYIIQLILNTIQVGSKISKNDASDYLIISAGDYFKDVEKVIVITYDKKMKCFLEKNQIFYDKTIYDKIYI